MGFFKTLFPGDISLYVGEPNQKYESMGMVEGMFDYDGIAISQSQAVEKAKTELKRAAASLNANAVINVKTVGLPSEKASTVLVYGDAVKYIYENNAS